MRKCIELSPVFVCCQRPLGHLSTLETPPFLCFLNKKVGILCGAEKYEVKIIKNIVVAGSN